MRKSELIDKVESLERKLGYLKDNLHKVEYEINQLKCPHKNIKFSKNYNLYKACIDCGKVLEMYANELEFNRDQVEYYRQKANEIETGV